jgi:hypothetical protein
MWGVEVMDSSVSPGGTQAVVYRNLGQVVPAATTETTLSAWGSGTPMYAVVSSVVVTNRGSTPTTFRISTSIGGGATATKDYLYYDIPIAGNDTFVATVGLTFLLADVVRVYAGNANLTFSLWGYVILPTA